MQSRPILLSRRSVSVSPVEEESPAAGEYDIKEVYTDLQGRLEWISSQEKLDWLVNENIRLNEENARLLEENRQLREELTLARLAREFEPGPKPGGGSAPSVPREAKRLYAHLPASFTFGEYFEIASMEGISSADGKEYLRLFLRHEMVRHKGFRVEKTGWIPYPVPPIPLTRKGH